MIRRLLGCGIAALILFASAGDAAIVCTPLGTTTAVLSLCKPAVGETGWGASYQNNQTILDSLFTGASLLKSLNGGTGVDGSAAANGAILIGNGTGYTLRTLTSATPQITVTNTAGTITLSAPTLTGGAGITVITAGGATTISTNTLTAGTGVTVTSSGGVTTIASGILTATTIPIGGAPLVSAGACTAGSVQVPTATTAMAVVATPATYPGDGIVWRGYVSAAGTVTVSVCSMVAFLVPVASAYNVRVIQ